MQRERWVDNVKIFACILVVLGHFFQSMCTSGILRPGFLYQWFNRTIYCFHTPLFFICSGYLYQKNSKTTSFAAWKTHVIKKLIALGVPYFVFSLVTWTLKMCFSSEVNLQAHTLVYDLFIHPISPYWYLFSAFFIFLITRTFCNKKSCYLNLTVAVLLKVLSGAIDCYAIKIVADNHIWFVLGMTAGMFKFSVFAEKLRTRAYISAGVFLALSIIDLTSFPLLRFIMGLLACATVMVLLFKTECKATRLIEYTLPVFLMHTIFAGGMRVVLLEFAIVNAGMHVVMGLCASFVGPVIAAEVMKKLKLDVLYQPGKYMKPKNDQGA